MWQRTQTILLVVSILCLLAMMFFPLWGGKSELETVIMYPLYLNKSGAEIYMPYTLTAILAIAAVTVSAIEITKYKNRVLQMKMGSLNSILMAGSLICAVVFIRQLEAAGYHGAISYNIFLPALAMVCNSIANRLIRKDENLVRESNRLR